MRTQSLVWGYLVWKQMKCLTSTCWHKGSLVRGSFTFDPCYSTYLTELRLEKMPLTMQSLAMQSLGMQCSLLECSLYKFSVCDCNLFTC